MSFFFSGAVAFLGIGAYLLLKWSFEKLRRDFGLLMEEDEHGD